MFLGLMALDLSVPGSDWYWLSQGPFSMRHSAAGVLVFQSQPCPYYAFCFHQRMLIAAIGTAI